MNTNNCLYCEKVNENMKGKLVVEVKVPDGMLTSYNYIHVSDEGGLFEVKLSAGSTFIYNIRKEMKIFAHLGSDKYGKTESVNVKPDEFYHFIIDYDYYYFQNQPRIKSVRWQRVKHISEDELYKSRFQSNKNVL